MTIDGVSLGLRDDRYLLLCLSRLGPRKMENRDVFVFFLRKSATYY